MKAKWPMILLIVFPYLALAAMAALFLWQGRLDGALLPLAALVILVTVPNTVYALQLSARPAAEQELLVWVRRVKLWHIPLYLLSFALCIALAITVVGLLMMPVVLVTLYMALLPASLYALTAMNLAVERGTLDPADIRTQKIQLFVPGLDIIAVIDLYAELSAR